MRRRRRQRAPSEARQTVADPTSDHSIPMPTQRFPPLPGRRRHRHHCLRPHRLEQHVRMQRAAWRRDSEEHAACSREAGLRRTWGPGPIVCAALARSSRDRPGGNLPGSRSVPSSPRSLRRAAATSMRLGFAAVADPTFSAKRSAQRTTAVRRSPMAPGLMP